MTKEQLEQRVKMENQRKQRNTKNFEEENGFYASSVKEKIKQQSEADRAPKERTKTKNIRANVMEFANETEYLSMLVETLMGRLEEEHNMREDAIRLARLAQTIIDEQRELLESYKQLLKMQR